jgi:hypothetical protein
VRGLSVVPYYEDAAVRGGLSVVPYYEDAAVTLYHGDCRDVLPTLGAVDHVITDPPYDEHTHTRQRRGSSAPGRGKQFGLSSNAISMERHVGFGFIGAGEMHFAATEFQRLARRWVLVFCAMEQQASWKAALTLCGLEHVRFGIWHKPGATPQFSGDRPGSVCEAIEIAHRPGRKTWNGGGRFAHWTVPIVKAQTGERCHPTQKPEALMEALITDFTDPGDVVLDAYAGSGSTGVAAKRLGRRAILIERDEAHAETSVKRLSQGALDLFGQSA